MNVRAYLMISGIIFAVVALAHLLRVINGWPVVAGSWFIPMWVSWVGTLGPGVLGVWAFSLASRFRVDPGVPR